LRRGKEDLTNKAETEFFGPVPGIGSARVATMEGTSPSRGNISQATEGCVDHASEERELIRKLAATWHLNVPER
jgi:hypothetical protein